MHYICLFLVFLFQLCSAVVQCECWLNGFQDVKRRRGYQGEIKFCSFVLRVWFFFFKCTYSYSVLFVRQFIETDGPTLGYKLFWEIEIFDCILTVGFILRSCTKGLLKIQKFFQTRFKFLNLMSLKLFVGRQE